MQPAVRYTLVRGFATFRVYSRTFAADVRRALRYHSLITKVRDPPSEKTLLKNPCPLEEWEPIVEVLQADSIVLVTARLSGADCNQSLLGDICNAVVWLRDHRKATISTVRGCCRSNCEPRILANGTRFSRLCRPIFFTALRDIVSGSSGTRHQVHE